MEGIEKPDLLHSALSSSVATVRLWYAAIGELDPVSNMEVVKLQETLEFVRTTALYITGFILSTFLLFYCLGKTQWGWFTHVDQYRWLYSAAYLSGNGAALGLVLLLVLVLTLSIYLISQFNSRSVATTERGGPASAVSRSKSVEPVELTEHKGLKNFASSAACFAINSSAVLSVQGGFVYAITWNDISPALVVSLQLLLACFSILWDNVVVLKLLIARFPNYLTPKGRIQLQNLIIIFNGVVAPLIVVGLTDPNCFSELITNTGHISTTSSVDYCVNVGTFGCYMYQTIVSQVSKNSLQ